ncbi:heme ABC exporter ATP-binding protein CcmA [Candidatus Bipolaricaulota bacterium]|nr:heme ABC exporter ATP-binding protein CcmA [Candidatus Bipolaricaulota bacterium]
MSGIIDTTKLTKIYPDGTEALQNLDFTLMEGEVLGLIGPNGAGKSTLVKLILGLLEPTSGSCQIWEENCYSGSQHYKKKIGFLLEHLGIYDNLTVRENMDFWRRLYEVKNSRVSKLLTQWGLEDKNNSFAKQLSAGMRQKLAIARSLLSNPPLIILDEPTSNLDPEARKQVVELLKGYSGEKTLLITSHDLFDIERICGRMVLLRRGKVSIEGTMEQIKDELGVGREVKVQLAEPVTEKLRENITEEFNVKIDQGGNIVVSDEKIEVKDLVSYLVDNGVEVELAEEERVTLEDIYTKIIKEDETN